MNFDSFIPYLNIGYLANVFASLLVIINPFAVVPVFLLLTKGDTSEYKRKIALRSTCIACGVLFIFAIVGDKLLDALNISEAAFRIAGGLLLLFAAIDMVIVKNSGIQSTTSDEIKEATKKTDISVFPLAIPMIAGPGSMTTIVMQMRSAEGTAQEVIMAVLFVVLLINYFCLLHADRLSAILGVTGTNVVTRVFGIILSAMAIQFMLNGVTIFVKQFIGAH